MGFFDNLGNKIQTGASAVATKTKDFAEVTKINSQISADTNAIATKFTEIGKKLYEKYADDGANEFADVFAEIKALEEKIATAKAQVKQIKGVKTCDKCGAEVASNTTFCGVCGAKIEADAVVAPEAYDTVVTVTDGAKVFCSECGNAEEAGTKFCSSCGNKISD